MKFMGAHVILYSNNAEADRAFLRDVLEFPSVDAGHGWLIFKLPVAEGAVHPTEGPDRAELYLMCEDLDAMIKSLGDKKVTCGSVDEERWGRKTTIRLPGGGEIGLYQPRHPTALDL